MSNKNLTAAVAVFKKNKNCTELFFTNDGQAFYTEGPAIVHQREIGGAKEAIEHVVAGDMANESEKGNVKNETEEAAPVTEEIASAKPRNKKKKETE